MRATVGEVQVAVERHDGDIVVVVIDAESGEATEAEPGGKTTEADRTAALAAFRRWREVTRRDYFAAAALTGMLAHPDCGTEDASPAEYARCAYRLADAMLAARDAAPEVTP